MPYKNPADKRRNARERYAEGRVGMADLRHDRPSGMVVAGTKVDAFQPRWVCAICAWSARTGCPNFPHVYNGRWHAVKAVAAA